MPFARFAALLGFILGCGSAFGQDARPPVFSGAPRAQWIGHPTEPGDAFGVWHFRRVIDLPSRPDKFIVHVSGDNRFRLFVNGQSVATGPERSDLAHWRYATLDLAPHLKSGRNVLAAVVWNWGPGRPVAQFSQRTAFLMQADSPRETAANTGPAWKVLADPALRDRPDRWGDDRRVLRLTSRRGGRRRGLSLGLAATRFQRRGLG